MNKRVPNFFFEFYIFHSQLGAMYMATIGISYLMFPCVRIGLRKYKHSKLVYLYMYMTAGQLFVYYNLE